LEHLGADLGVHGRGGEIGMAKKFLDYQKRLAAFQQVGGEAMTQHMRRDMGGYTDASCRSTDDPCGGGG
jgi:hypothetical protein